MKGIRSAALIGLLSISATTHAVPIVYDFSGTGYVSSYESGSSLHTGTITGSLSFNINSPTTIGENSYTTDTVAYSSNGWVDTVFFIDWGTGNFTPQPVPGQTSAQSTVLVQDHPQVDGLIVTQEFAGLEIFATGLATHYSYARLNLSTTDTAWLSDLSFPSPLTLSSIGTNELYFYDYTFRPGNESPLTGINGFIKLDSLSARPTSVPEPGSLALFGIGFVGLAVSRRRRARSS